MLSYSYPSRLYSSLPKARPNFDELPENALEKEKDALENEVPLIPRVCEVPPTSPVQATLIPHWTKIKAGPDGLFDGYLQVSLFFKLKRQI